MNNAALKLKPYLWLLVILFIAYLPLSTFYFGMKNDAFSDNFPNKYFFTAALHSGHLPLWNPYMNFGFPIYADPGFAFWSPITWLIGSAIGYTAYTLTFEVLLYLYLAGVCMFHLGKYFKFSSKVCIAIAAMYMCSGFFVGCLQYINFLTSAAFLPLLVLCFLRLQKAPSYQNAFWCGCAYYLILCGGHPAIPIATAYFVVALFVLQLVFDRSLRNNIKPLFCYNAVAVAIAACMFLPALYSYINVWPHYARNSAAEQSYFTSTGFTLASYVSYLFPFLTISKDFFSNDVAMRNGYFSVAGFALLIYAISTKNRQALQYLLLGLLMLLIAAGGFVKASMYSHLPGLNFVRYNGEFRVFSILCFCIASGFGLHEAAQYNFAHSLYKKILAFIALISIAAIVIALTLHPFAFFKTVPSQTLVEKIKWILSNAPFRFFLLISGTITVLITVLLFMSKKNITKYLPAIVIADLAINCILYLPVTGVGQVTLSSIQKIYDQNPNGIPKPNLIAINAIDTLDFKTTGLVGDLTYYNKQIGTTKLTDYPSYFTTTDQFFHSNLKNSVTAKPFIFSQRHLADTASAAIQIIHFTPQHIELTIKSTAADTLVILQNNYKYWSAAVDNKSVRTNTLFYSFIGIPIHAGTNTINLTYKDASLLPLSLFSLLFFATNCFVCLRRKPTSQLSKQNL